jgi:hypothetical protein
MVVKVVRGQLMVFNSAPLDELGLAVVPTTVRLHLNYIHFGETVARSDPAIDMVYQVDGTFRFEFDTKDTEPGSLFVSIRTTGPPSAWDAKYQITANAANPEDVPTA